MTRPLPEVVVLGGGPAGAAAALLLAGWGHRVTLLTRLPHHQPLVESLPPSTTTLLDRIGLRAAVDRAGFLRTTGNTAWWGADDARPEYFAPGATGYQVPRGRFDALLLEAAERAGATVVRQAVVRSVTPAGADPLWSVAYEHEGAACVLPARWVLDCTGRAGLAARQGWRQAEPGVRTTALVATWEQDHWPLPDVSHTVVESFGDGWAWSVPESSTRRQVAVMVDPGLSRIGGAAGLLSRYHAELQRARHLHAMLAPARAVESPWARDASPYSAVRTGEAGLLLAGDAASFVDPLSSFGIKKALASAWLAAVAVRTALDDPGLTGPALAFHQQREQVMVAALRRRAAEFSRDAMERHRGEYWARRLAGDDDDATVGEADVAALREDAAVQAAFHQLRQRDPVRFRRGPRLERVRRPAIHGTRIALEDQLILDGLPGGIRWLRAVDLVLLTDLAPEAEGVPQLFEACLRQSREATLPDVLGALAVLLARGGLELA